MNTTEIMLIALGLAMDAFAVSIANGVIIKQVKLTHALTFGMYFGIFQCGMALIGWALARTFSCYLSGFANWVAFVLLFVIGCNMINDGVKTHKSSQTQKDVSDKEILRLGNMSMLAIATSIDAFAVGISFAMVNTNIMSPAIVIGLFALILSFLGVLIGNKLNKVFNKYAEIVGGIILLVIAVKILIQNFL